MNSSNGIKTGVGEIRVRRCLFDDSPDTGVESSAPALCQRGSVCPVRQCSSAEQRHVPEGNKCWSFKYLNHF